MHPADPTLNEVFDRFLARPSEDGPRERSEFVVDLFRSYLDGYGHDLLTEEQQAFWQRRYDEDEEKGSFCNLFGPPFLIEGLDPFLGWFVIRKVAMQREDIAVVGPVTLDLTDWLVEEGYVDDAVAEGAADLARDASEQLPRADRLAELLHWSGKSLKPEHILEHVDWETEEAVISRIETGMLWFRSELGEIGPVEVPQLASEDAEVGWKITALSFARTPIGWFILEMGNVYPA